MTILINTLGIFLAMGIGACLYDGMQERAKQDAHEKRYKIGKYSKYYQKFNK